MIANSMFKNFIGQNCPRTDDDVKKHRNIFPTS